MDSPVTATHRTFPAEEFGENGFDSNFRSKFKQTPPINLNIIDIWIVHHITAKLLLGISYDQDSRGEFRIVCTKTMDMQLVKQKTEAVE
ncbi:unnamed protein product [Ambrosiozyma monospora]|uniref:Unnamed protein product n=1 Tax=Ambrosiozyma monospora TaxID=43982 RepID=A0A9W6SYX3_AMBMO|nr:unnamed protein product [Ambrosiozyma monospora]